MIPVGIPREIKVGERRVALTPDGVKVLRENGVPVFVETRAGEASHFTDRDYQRSGAEIVSTAQELWEQSDLIQKVKEPQISEFPYLQKHHLLFAFLHLASQEECGLLKALCESQSTAIAFESVVKDGKTCILAPMSQIAGRLAAYFAGLLKTYVKIQKGGVHYDPLYWKVQEDWIRRYPDAPSGVNPGVVVVLGGGQVGEHAGEMAAKMGARVSLSEINTAKRSQLEERYLKDRLSVTLIDGKGDMTPILEDADVLIGAVYLTGERAPLLVDQKTLEKISGDRKKIILDIAMDQGGNIFGSRVTTYADPVFVDAWGNLRFGVTNIPSLLGARAAFVLEKASLPYTLALAHGLEYAVEKFPELKAALVVRGGELVDERIKAAHRLT